MGDETQRRKLLRRVAIVLALATVSCTNPPVQEMSDARQAIRAAHEAGASKTSPEDLAGAEVLLTHAEQSLDAHQFRTARHYAVDARSKALGALEAARQQSDARH
jgi:hypothetical protein